MKCNKCGSIFDNTVKFCTKCGNNLQNQIDNICPACGAMTDISEVYCSNCGYFLKESHAEENLNKEQLKLENNNSLFERLANSKDFYPICLGIIIFTMLIALISGLCTTNIPELIKEKTTPKAPDCEAQTVKDLVISIVKKNDYFFKYIDPGTISKIYLRYPASTGYEKDIDKHHCTGQFVIESTYGGFKPTVNEYTNHYYNKFHSYLNLYEDKLTKNTTYICDVKYSSQLSEGQTLVESTYCSSSGGWFDTGNEGKFSCEAQDCDPIIIHKKDQEKVEDSINEDNTVNNNNKDSSYTDNAYSYINNSNTTQTPQSHTQKPSTPINATSGTKPTSPSKTSTPNSGIKSNPYSTGPGAGETTGTKYSPTLPNRTQNMLDKFENKKNIEEAEDELF